MTLGDIIEKIRRMFGGKPRIMQEIADLEAQIRNFEDRLDLQMRTNTRKGEEINELKRQLAVESNPQNQDLLMDKIEARESSLEGDAKLVQEIKESINRLQKILDEKRRGVIVDSGPDIATVIQAANEAEETAEKKKALAEAQKELEKAAGIKPRTERSKRKEAADRAARRAALLGTAGPAPAEPANPAPSPSAPAAPAPAAPEPAPETPAPTVAAG